MGKYGYSIVASNIQFLIIKFKKKTINFFLIINIFRFLISFVDNILEMPRIRVE